MLLCKSGFDSHVSIEPVSLERPQESQDVPTFDTDREFSDSGGMNEQWAKKQKQNKDSVKITT